jgi:hypothetical protein
LAVKLVVPPVKLTLPLPVTAPLPWKVMVDPLCRRRHWENTDPHRQHGRANN